MTVEARELYSSSMGPIVSGSRTPFRANAHRARAERSLWRRIGESGVQPQQPLIARLATALRQHLVLDAEQIDAIVSLGGEIQCWNRNR